MTVSFADSDAADDLGDASVGIGADSDSRALLVVAAAAGDVAATLLAEFDSEHPVSVRARAQAANAAKGPIRWLIMIRS
ncbi:hypothetical protein WSS_A03215 [Rhodococcus opacus M213]|uniref:Uncharacterized protein n=1 Tax=Rhodococcus opacus M213 TaxID=1129896 RepID=K8Y0C8_RHOOP|nr:hypothetical protein WSS_A03215 [Rhodococcus opacus M213]